MSEVKADKAFVERVLAQVIAMPQKAGCKPGAQMDAAWLYKFSSYIDRVAALESDAEVDRQIIRDWEAKTEELEAVVRTQGECARLERSGMLNLREKYGAREDESFEGFIARLSTPPPVEMPEAVERLVAIAREVAGYLPPMSICREALLQESKSVEQHYARHAQADKYGLCPDCKHVHRTIYPGGACEVEIGDGFTRACTCRTILKPATADKEEGE